MKIMKPSYEILTEIDGIKMLQHIEKIGRVCYKSEDKITDDGESAKAFVKMLINRGHEAMIEYSMISVKFTVDRGVSHELVRHRIASFAQESTRYCNYSNDKFGSEISVIVPSWFEYVPSYYEELLQHKVKDVSVFKNTELEWLQQMGSAEASYLRLLDMGWSAQEARSVLPNSLKTDIAITMDFRNWRNFFRLRTPMSVHPQMREVTIPLLGDFKSRIPVVFDDIELPEV
jgi:thymidylate synthase (FAD)